MKLDRCDELLRTTIFNYGERYVVGPHGEWFTEAEQKAIATHEWKRIPSVGHVMPNLPLR
jgi:hypothetical protein